jgi:hypothetical protein
MNILYLFYLFVFNNYKNEKLGTDQRYPLVENTLDLDSIIKNNNKKILLDFLKSKDISIYDKIKKLDEFDNSNTIKPINIFKCGLFTDWDFEI